MGCDDDADVLSSTASCGCGEATRRWSRALGRMSRIPKIWIFSCGAARDRGHDKGAMIDSSGCREVGILEV